MSTTDELRRATKFAAEVEGLERAYGVELHIDDGELHIHRPSGGLIASLRYDHNGNVDRAKVGGTR